MATHLLPLLADEETWVPEHGRAMPLLQRIHYPEKHMYLRLRLVETSPGKAAWNMVDCGAAMYRPGRPDERRRSRGRLPPGPGCLQRHQHSFGLEAAA